MLCEIHWVDALFTGYQCRFALMKENPSGTESCASCWTSLRVCAPVEAELWFWVAKRAWQELNQARLLTLLKWLPSLPFAGQSTRHFGDSVLI